MISSVPPPIGPSRASRAARSISYSTDVAGAAVDLQARVHHLERRPLRRELGDRHLAHRVLAGDVAAQRRVGDVAPGLDRDRDLGELVADRLKRRSPSERLRSSANCERLLERHLHPADRAERHQQPLPLEVGHDQVEAAVLLAEQVLLGDEHVVEGDQRRVRGVPAELLERARLDARARAR